MQRGLLQAVMATPRVCGDHSSFPFDVCFRMYHSSTLIRLISYMWVRAKDIVQRAAEPPSRRTKRPLLVGCGENSSVIRPLSATWLLSPLPHATLTATIPVWRDCMRRGEEGEKTQDPSLPLIVGVLFPSMVRSIHTWWYKHRRCQRAYVFVGRKGY